MLSRSDPTGVLRLLVFVLLLWALVVLAQPAPTCEQQVQETYQGLTKDQLLVPVPELSWQQQLVAIAQSPREYQMRWEMKRNQVDLAETNVAKLLVQLREAQAEISRLKAQLAQDPKPSN